MMIEQFRYLPDYMSTDSLEEEFNKFLIIIKSMKYNLIDALEALSELSDRQWHTYQYINKEIKVEIENWILSILNFKSLEIIELIFLPIGALGLTKVFEILKNSLQMDLENDMREEIEEFIKECNGNIDDPYNNLK